MSNERGNGALLIVCGLQGTGKTTVASALARTLGAVHLRNDVIRKELFLAPTYEPDETDKAYEEVLRRAEPLLKEGKTIILDATFAKETHREAAKKLADDTRSSFLIFRTVADESIVKERIEARANDASDAVFDDHLKTKKRFEPISMPHTIIDTGAAPLGA